MISFSCWFFLMGFARLWHSWQPDIDGARDLTLAVGLEFFVTKTVGTGIPMLWRAKSHKISSNLPRSSMQIIFDVTEIQRTKLFCYDNFSKKFLARQCSELCFFYDSKEKVCWWVQLMLPRFRSNRLWRVWDFKNAYREFETAMREFSSSWISSFAARRTLSWSLSSLPLSSTLFLMISSPSLADRLVDTCSVNSMSTRSVRFRIIRSIEGTPYTSSGGASFRYPSQNPTLAFFQFQMDLSIDRSIALVDRTVLLSFSHSFIHSCERIHHQLFRSISLNRTIVLWRW